MTIKFGRIISVTLGVLMLTAICATAYIFSPAFERPLVRGLAEEKSYVNHAGTPFRMRRELWGQAGNFETWDLAERIANRVEELGPKGTWSKWSDQIAYLPDSMRHDPSGHPMCVIRMQSDVYVVRGVRKQVKRCDPVTPGFGVKDVKSGDLVPSSDSKAEIYYQTLGN